MQISEHKNDFDKAVEYLKNDITSLRTGRATTALVEDLPVNAYGARQPLKAVGTINVLDAKTVAIEPWDKSLMVEIEKAVRDSSLGINPVNNGKQIILALPQLTSERRAELIKVLHQKLEGARISLRKIREDVKDLIMTAEKDKAIGEDERYKLQEDLEKMVKDYNEKIKTIGEEKEKEINSV
ncbi:MAG: ribosome recycling factor [Candidatus Magasanikbacteria bacterium CG10_big_fil_rev_8_21_14_0_10_40_10]|uniref:Ribosome-recycling factor n=1 Tax=Candidatus Magasanikbacteria bacterium CG10_big_fil_rev_8_21_14_0_10_40_10 TaxID=1974648 RepID=A0A2M6W307_9BACT|nr:MAG: ribosome recycling factor [Candidatus Magasanikbacteria bacterium CG10_big_fil_rev_8_21_14_0_10_40_10]